MACLLANGRAESCKDIVGGLKNIYFINYGITASMITYDGTDTDMIDTVDGIVGGNLYKFELKGSNSFEQTINSSRENGTTFYEQVLSIQLKKQDASTAKIVKLLAYGRPHIVVESNAGQYFLAGLENGCDVTAGNIANGTGLGDFNGYGLTFTAQEKINANFIDVTTEALLATAFATSAVDATIVTS